jgi:2-amino-4-hydroxy-6-hydroxymethyldihydropteridine diphosphokinase
MTVTAYVALGSNLGDRLGYLAAARQALRARKDVALVRVSTVYETAPVGGPAGQGPYLNAAAEIGTTLSPDELLRVLLDIEQRNGRVRTEPDGPRTLDLDLLLYGEVVRESPDPIVPHPRLHERLFVLQPLAEIAPNVIHPILKRSIADVLADRLGIRPIAPMPGRELLGMRALVTGSTSGIGKAIALELARGGADVLVHGRRSIERANSVAAEVGAFGVCTGALVADLRDPTACHHLADAAWRFWNGLDILVNNAGADTLTGSAASWPFEQKLEALLGVDVSATIALARDVGRRMKERGAGVIVNMGWDQAESGMEGDSGELFAATKGAVMAFSRSLALSLAPEVRVHCLAPGWIRTAWGESASAAWQQRVQRETPLQRWGTPEDVAATTRFLVSPAAPYLTGQVVRVNGGAVR